MQVEAPRGLMRRHERATYLIVGAGFASMFGDWLHGRWARSRGPALDDRRARRGRGHRQRRRGASASCASGARCGRTAPSMPQPANQNRSLKTADPRPEEPGAARARGRAPRAGRAGLRADGRRRRRSRRGHARSPTSTATRSSTSSAASRSARSATRTRPGSTRSRSRPRSAAVGSLTSEARVELFERFAQPRARERRAPAAAVLGRRRGRRERAAAREVAHRQVRVRELLGRLPRQDDGRAVADGLDVQGQARPDGAGQPPGAVRRLLSLPARARATRACGIACAEVARKYVKVATAGAVAGVIVEPMQGTAGNIVPPKEFLPAMKSIARGGRRAVHRRRDDHRASAAPARGGASTTPACVPDIVTIGKAVGGGFPLSALATTDEIARGEAVVERVGELVELRRQPARGRGGRGVAARSSRTRTSSRTRGGSAR